MEFTITKTTRTGQREIRAAGLFRKAIYEEIQQTLLNVKIKFSHAEEKILTQYNLWSEPGLDVLVKTPKTRVPKEINPAKYFPEYLIADMRSLNPTFERDQVQAGLFEGDDYDYGHMYAVSINGSQDFTYVFEDQDILAHYENVVIPNFLTALRDYYLATPQRAAEDSGLQPAPPPPPVERMTATLDITGSTVTLKLQFSEEERAIITTHRLYEVPFEDEPMYTEEQIWQFKEAREDNLRRGDSYNAHLEREIGQGITDDVVENMRHRRRLTTIADYLMENGYVKRFDTPYDASAYANKLKTDILPRIKKLIEANRRGESSSETIEF